MAGLLAFDNQPKAEIGVLYEFVFKNWFLTDKVGVNWVNPSYKNGSGKPNLKPVVNPNTNHHLHCTLAFGPGQAIPLKFGCRKVQR